MYTSVFYQLITGWIDLYISRNQILGFAVVENQIELVQYKIGTCLLHYGTLYHVVSL